MSLAYKVEELLALRDSVSESAVSIDKFADEDVIKEHVLRPSVSANIIRAASFEKPLRASATPGVSSAATNLKKPSPSPSIKRGKAERLLKEHGSPPGMRVTAGGRVVPSDLPPLSSARFGSNNLKLQGLGLRSGDHSNGLSAQSQSDLNNNLTPQVHIVGTQAVIRIGDKMYALPSYDQNYPMASVSSGLDTTAQPGVSARVSSIPLAPQVSRAQSPFPCLDVPTLEAQWASKKEELRYVEQTEVLQADQQGPVWRNQMIARKKSLILEIDGLRKQISMAKEADASKGGDAPTTLPGAGASATTVPAYVPPFQQSIAPGLYPPVGVPIIPTPSPFQPLMMFPPYSASGPQAYPADVPQFGRDSQVFVPGDTVTNGHFAKPFTQTVTASQSPGSASRRSHAVPIKKPNDDTKKQVAQTSRLDPKSPTYEPVNKSVGHTETEQNQPPPTPSPVKSMSSPWCSNEAGSGQSNKREDRAISQRPSLSSIDTTDFFPTNTHEHSSTRIAPNKLSKQPSCENAVIPATPDKAWPTGPWNPPSAGQASRTGLSAQNDAARRLTSWPEAFGKQPSVPSSTSKPTGDSGISSSSALRNKSSAENTSTDLNWPAIASKPIQHVPSTYQEGYQAGMLHSGLPDNVAVLSGYADGIAQFLKERNARERKDRNYQMALFPGHTDQETSSARSSLRGYISSGNFHDSAVSFVENMRSGKSNANASAGYRQSIYSPRGDDMDAGVTYTLRNDLPLEPYSRGQTVGMGQGNPIKSPANANQNKEDQGRPEFVQPNLAFARQFSGNQMGNRMYGTPVSMQRYYPAPKEYAHEFPNGNTQAARPVARQRFSGLDGAMDDLAGLVVDTPEEKATDEAAEAEASCFKSSSGKGKQPASSPTKSNPSNAKEGSSPGKGTGSPRRPGELSPAKAKLEHVTNKLRRPRKDDPRTMSPEDKLRRTEKWRGRFRYIKTKEDKDIADYRRDNARDYGEGSRR